MKRYYDFFHQALIPPEYRAAPWIPGYDIMDLPERTARCPDCDAEVSIDAESVLNEIILCQNCDLELELIELDPPTLQEAPPVEEDWGE